MTRDTLYSPLPNEKPTPMVSSRLAKREQKKLLTQTLLFGVGAVVLLGAFFFLILPGVAKLWNMIAGTGDLTFDQSDTIPPQVPILSAPAEATNSASIQLSGFGEAKSILKVVVNGEQITQETIKDDGSFSFELGLKPGENIVNTYAVDEAKNESAVSRTYTVVFDNEAPKIEVAEPQAGQTIELRKNQSVTIKGITEPRARVYVNGRMAFANSEGAFSTTYLLQEGENKLQLKAEDLAGNITEQELIVNFKF